MKDISSPPFPKEHGAWGILIGAFLSVIAYTKAVSLSQICLLFSIVLFYIARASFLNILRGKNKHREGFWFFVFAGLGWLGMLLTAYLAQYWEILGWSLIMLPFLGAEVLLIKFRKQMSLLAQLIGTIGLSMIAPLTMLLYQQKVTFSAGFIWLIDALFFTSGILFVRYQIAIMKQTSDYMRYQISIIIYHIGLLLFLFWLHFTNEAYSGWLLVFTPMLLQTFYFLISKLQFRSLRTVGWLQIGHTLVFIILLLVVV